jgi:hypothetical protein
MRLPDSIPAEDPDSVRALQEFLLQEAERLLWPRNPEKTILPPVFTEGGPMVRNTPDLKGAFAELSFAARTFWPTVVFELAHETVHLLNPVPRNGNKLEEGVAVEFSIYAQEKLGAPIIQQPTKGFYLSALQLVRLLPGGVFQAARHIREAHGPLSDVTARQLQALYPEIEIGMIRKLCRQMNRQRLPSHASQPPARAGSSRTAASRRG